MTATIRAAAVTRTVDASADTVWRVLADGWAYPTWVVGASRVRAVDTSWPAVGACIHHSFGVWPLVVDDTTEVKGAQARESSCSRREDGRWVRRRS